MSENSFEEWKNLASKISFPNQAFQYGDTSFGLQFHAEVNEAVLDFWLRRHPLPADLERFGAQSVNEQFNGHAKNANSVHSWLGTFLKCLIKQKTDSVF